MSKIALRIKANLVFLLLFSAAVLLAAFLRFATSGGFEAPYTVSAALPEAGGVLPGQEVTVLGRAVGQVADVELTQDGVEVTVEIPRQFDVPEQARVTVLRRSPIGEQAVDFEPVSDNWEPAEPGAEIAVLEAVVPAEVPVLLEQTVELFSAIDTDDFATVIEELSLALEGRGQTLVQLNRDALDLNRTLVAGIPELERLTEQATVQTIDTLRANADDLAETFDNAAALAELLAEEAPTIDRLLDTSPVALTESAGLIEEQSANVGCLLDDLTSLNNMLTGPSTGVGFVADNYSSKLDEFEAALNRHQFFFQEGFSIVNQPDVDAGVYWARIDLLADEAPAGQRYEQLRPTPQTRPGAACISEEFGLGVNAVRQADHQPPEPSAPPIDFAPLASGERNPGRGVDAPDLDTSDGGGGGLAATGGGVILAAPLLLGLALVLRRRP